MREISAALITKSVARMCIEANCYLPEDVRARLEGSLRDEPWPIAQEILNQHKGRIEISSEYGKGTSVLITMPAAEAQA